MAASGFLTAPFCIATVFVLYWSIALGCLVGRIRFWDFKGGRNDTHSWAIAMNAVLGVKYLKVGTNSLYKDGRCVYLCNHRSWADFFVDIYLTEGLAQPMARTMVYIAFPMFMTSVFFLKGVVLFKRGAIADKVKFNAWLDSKLTSSPAQNLLVYPEGHRSIQPKSLSLKRGMLYYAHSRGLPVQVIMARGKELILSEKKCRAGYGVHLPVAFSELVSSEGRTFDEFAAAVQSTWDKTWSTAYGVDLKGLRPLQQQDVPLHDYPVQTRYRQGAWCIVCIVGFAFALWLWYAALAWAISWLPSVLQVVGWVAVAAFFGLSVHASIIDNDAMNTKVA
uniref:Phospholipid/glycerol acyltransferase domain-containing protein n=1 Tax=Chlamydomonas euryale TaxID=1486919 RepID=A0A7R9VG05_9CHLO|mmetsp:Transcript_34406/g.102210  ORF Transcript_34406/g.102210 Transcript_34406/m.102210 type:complete len:335 (+) Transcript_34406:191-1195(+)